MGTTTDPSDPRLTRGVDAAPVPQAKVYLVLSEAERAKGYVRPLRDTYRHVGAPPPKYPLRDLTPEEEVRHAGSDYVKFEAYPESESPMVGSYWTQARLDRVGSGCGTTTTMGYALAATYARNPSFYGATYCVGCQKHLAVSDFVWLDGERVGS